MRPERFLDVTHRCSGWLLFKTDFHCRPNGLALDAFLELQQAFKTFQTYSSGREALKNPTT